MSSRIYHPHQADDAECSPQADLIAAEPVLALAGVEHHLQEAEAERQKSDAPQVDSAELGFAKVRWVDDEVADHQQRENPHRQIDVEDPAPGVVVGDPAAQRRPQDGRDDNAQAECRHRRAMLFGRESFQQHRLRQRLQASTAEALQHAKEDQRLQAGRHTAEQRTDGEAGNAQHQHAPPPKAHGQPSRHGQNDGVRHQVRGDDPRALFVSRAHIPRHVRDRNVDHSGVEHLHERGQHDSDGDDPGIAADWGGTGHRSS